MILTDNIFSALLKKPSFFRIVFPHLKPDYFTDSHDRLLFSVITKYIQAYSKFPTFVDLKLKIERNFTINEKDTAALFDKIAELQTIEEVSNEELLINETEKWAQDRAMEIAIRESIEILDKEDANRGAIKEAVNKALSVQFITKVGMDYFSEMAQRIDWYKNDEESIPLDIDVINKAMGGGLKRKAIAVFIAPPKRGKSLWMTHCAASLIKSGKNVLYVSCELSEKMITKRIDANMLDIEMNNLGKDLDEEKFKGKFNSILAKTHGELIVKEFPSINSLQLTALLHDLQQKKKFKPDVIILDYINICSSSYLNSSHVGNTNLYIGKIVMEMRNVAIEQDVAMLSAVQNNRGGVKKTTDTGMDDIADAFSIAMNVDWGGAIIQTDELRGMKKYLLKTVLTRWDENSNDIYTVGVEYNKMRLVNLDEDQQVLPKEMVDQLKSIALRDKKNAEAEHVEEEKPKASLINFS